MFTANVHGDFAFRRQHYPRTGPHKLPSSTCTRKLVTILSIQHPVEYYFLQILSMGIGSTQYLLPRASSFKLSPYFSKGNSLILSICIYNKLHMGLEGTFGASAKSSRQLDRRQCSCREGFFTLQFTFVLPANYYAPILLLRNLQRTSGILLHSYGNSTEADLWSLDAFEKKVGIGKKHLWLECLSSIENTSLPSGLLGS